MKNRIVFVLTAHHEYMRADSCGEREFCSDVDALFPAIERSYVPLLNMLERLEKDRVPCVIQLAISPSLCTLLEDAQVQQQYLSWIDRRIEFGAHELERCQSDERMRMLARRCHEDALRARSDFDQKYGRSVIGKLAEYSRKGMISLAAVPATNLFIPHYMSMPESVSAQIEAGLFAVRQFFGTSPEGFYLPHLGYAEGLDALLKPYGIHYTIVDSRAVLFSGGKIRNGIFAPVRSSNSLGLFANDVFALDSIAGAGGFSCDGAYLNPHRDIGYELDSRQLEGFLADGKSRIATGFCYFSNGSGAGCEELYNPDKAREQVLSDAALFAARMSGRLARAAELTDSGDAASVCVMPAELFGCRWAEGMAFLEQVIRRLAQEEGTELSSCEDIASAERLFSIQKIEPYPCASGESGYGEELLDSTNAWRMRYVTKAVSRMIDLAGRFNEASGLKARLLNIGARAVLLAQSSDWPRMMHDGRWPEEAREAVCELVEIFSTVFDSLGSNTVSTEWLTSVEKKYPIFPWMNYKIFSRKV